MFSKIAGKGRTFSPVDLRCELIIPAHCNTVLQWVNVTLGVIVTKYDECLEIQCSARRADSKPRVPATNITFRPLIHAVGDIETIVTGSQWLSTICW